MPFCTTCGSEVQGKFCVKCGAPAGAGAPQMSPGAVPSAPAPVAAAAPAKKKTSPLVWILGILGLLVILVVVGIVGAGFFLVHKVKQAGFDPELMQKNPGLAMTRMLAAANPDVEVVKVDEGRGVITLRDKKTGETTTVNFEDVKQGRVSFKNEKGESVTFDAKGGGDSGSFTVKSSDGTFQAGGGTNAKVPSWIPVVPGSQVQGQFREQKADGENGAFSYSAGKPVNDVVQFYAQGLRASGLEVDSQPENGRLSANDESKGREVTVNVAAEGSGSRVVITYSAKQ